MKQEQRHQHQRREEVKPTNERVVTACPHGRQGGQVAWPLPGPGKQLTQALLRFLRSQTSRL